MSRAKAVQTSKDRLAANAFLVIMMAPVLFLIWRYQQPKSSPSRKDWSTP